MILAADGPEVHYQLDLYWVEDPRFQSFDGQPETIVRKGTDLYLLETDDHGLDHLTPITSGFLLDANGDRQGEVYNRTLQAQMDASCPEDDSGCYTLYLSVGEATPEEFGKSIMGQLHTCHETPMAVRVIYDPLTDSYTPEKIIEVAPLKP